jgi:hypothetical protein
MAKKICMIIGLFLFVLLFSTPLNTKGMAQPYNNISDFRATPFGFRSLPSNATLLHELYDATNFRVHDSSQFFDGYTITGVGVYPNYTGSNERVGLMVVMDMDGNVHNGFYSSQECFEIPQLIDSKTVVYFVKGDENLSLWDMVANTTEVLPIPRSGHDVEYNALTDTFLTIQKTEFSTFYWEGKTMSVKGNELVEYDRDGNELWRWDGNLTFPFDAEEFYLRNETKKTDIDWMHGNSVYWDVDEDSIYFNVRTLDCVVKINHTSGETIWVAGRYVGEGPGLTLYNKNGVQVDSLFYHTHACDYLGDNTFVIYDNDLYNLTRPNPEIGVSRLVKFVVNETAGTATETWSWAAPPSYYCGSQGDANHLPNGNVVGQFNLSPEPILVEVNQAGEVVWELVLNLTENDVGWRWVANTAQRFVDEPLIELGTTSFTIYEGTPLEVGFSAWDTYHRRYTANATVRLLEGSTVLAEDEFPLLAHWQETAASISIPILPAGLHNLTLEVRNVEGQVGQLYFSVNIISALLNPINLAIIGVVLIVAIVIIVFLYRRRSS